MRRVIKVIVLAVALLPGHFVPASQTDKRLDALFERLRTTESESEAAALSSRVWEIWLQTESHVVGAFLADGIGEMSRRNYEEALASFNKVVEAAPDFAEGWNKRATVYYLMGDFEASVRDIERTLALEPRHFGALSGLGLIYLAIGEERAALDAFEAALKVNPHLSSAKAHVEELRRRLRDRRI